jgi:transcriptional regulator of acetoin/glycerol metabolism
MGQASNHGGSPPVDPEENGSDSISFEGDDPASIPSMEKLKKQAVKRAYEMFDGDVDRASVALDIARSTVYRMLKRYDLRESDD